VTRPRPLPLAAAAGLLAAGILTGGTLVGCGKKGPPSPPIRILPASAQGVKVRQIGTAVEIAAIVSEVRTDGSPLGPGMQVRVMRLPTTETLRPEAVSPRYLLRQFEKEAKVVARLGGEELGLAAPGGRLRVRDADAVSGVHAGVRSRFLYGVVVVDADGKRSPLHPPVSIEVLEPPPAPVDLKAEVAEGEVRLAWSSGGPMKEPLYNIYRKGAREEIDPEAPLNPKPLPATSFVDTTFHYGEEYVYVARSLAAAGMPFRESVDSAGVEVRPLDRFPPAAPTGLAATAEGSVIKLYWFPNTELDLGGYRIDRREAPDAPPLPLGEVGPAETSYIDSTARAGVRYYYTVAAFDLASPRNESARSDERSEMLAPDAARPATPPAEAPRKPKGPGTEKPR